MPPLSPATSDDDDCGGSSAVSVEGGVCHVINLSHTTVSGVLKVFSALKQPEFTTLELSHGELDQFALEKLTQTFLRKSDEYEDEAKARLQFAHVAMHTYGITTLKLSQCPLPEGVVTVLVRCFKETGSLRKLVLDTYDRPHPSKYMNASLQVSRCEYDGANDLDVAKLTSSTSLTTRDNITNTPSIILDTLDLSDNGISNVGFCCILTISVRHLHVGRNNITSVRDVATTAHPHLTSLDMSYNPISTDGFDSFGGLITSAHANLTSLNIEV
ncbi:hypothetical protein DYB38_001835 [Aphanomyces astaci]|uniref:Uncharacterized protein n=1 Tax=Aphanomyces astaci TaxID=112090 RepID=A0A397DVF4_APHAT|nr:hypothetical protein DYB36_005227 [Aphanomyces astaci]RHY68658.1 hypothetical protein DYB38_001835 [Aphanomyces astaci]